MKKLKIIFNLITLALTTGLLVMITLAWYAVNKQASVEAGTGAVANLPGLVEQVDYYNFNQVSDIQDSTDKQYTIETHETNTGTCDMQKYLENFDPNYKPTIYYIRIQLKENVSISQLRFISSATAFVGFGTDGTGGVINSNDNLSLSSVIRFAYLGCSGAYEFVDEDDSSATFGSLESYTWNSFEYASNGVITTSTINVLGNTLDGARYIHLLLDYDVSHLNEFYGNNLANQTILNADGGPKFTNTDFTIYLLS